MIAMLYIKALIALHSKCRLIIIISIAPKWTRLLNQDFSDKLPECTRVYRNKKNNHRKRHGSSNSCNKL